MRKLKEVRRRHFKGDHEFAAITGGRLIPEQAAKLSAIVTTVDELVSLNIAGPPGIMDVYRLLHG